jgi:UDP-glucose 4-epimerase
MKIKGSRVLITGGAGFIGSHIVDGLVKEQAKEVVVVDNLVRGTKENLAWAQANGHVTVIEADITNRELLTDVMEGIDLLFHQAAIRITQCAQEPRLALEVLVDGTYNVMEAAVSARVKKVISASSASVYGLADEFPTRESHHPYNNRTLYGAAKLFNEALLRSFYEMYGLDYLMLRPFNVYGPRMDVFGVYTEVFIRWMERIENGQPPVIFGNGSQTLDFVHVEDVARAYIMAAETDYTDAVFNAASGVETSLKELAELLLKVMGSNLSPEHGPERKVNGVTRRVADITMGQKLLNFTPRIGLEEGLRGLVDWWREKKLECKGENGEGDRSVLQFPDSRNAL